MAESFAQFKDEVPILRDTKIASGAKGFEAIGQALGNVSQGLIQTDLRLEQEKSNALLLQATSSADQIKSDALVKLKTHPQLASQIAQDTQQQLDNIKNTTPVNNKTKGQLDALLQSSRNQVNSQTQLIDYQTNQLKLTSQFYTEWPNVLKDLYTSVNDDKLFRQKLDLAHQTIEKAMLGRIITPKQCSVFFKTLSQSLDSLNQLHQLQKNPDARSSDLQIALASPFAQGIDKSNTPISQATQHLQDHYDNDLTMRGIKTDLIRGNPINPLAWMKLTPDHLNEITLYASGAQKAQGLFNNGENWQLIKQRYDELNTKNGLLTQAEKGEQATLQHFVNGFNNGDYLSLIEKTPQGMAIINQRQLNEVTADPRAAYNNSISQLVQLGHAMQIDNHFIQPIPDKYREAAQSAFIQGADPDSLLQVLGNHNPSNKVYVAASLKKPLQQEVAYTVGLLQGNTDLAFLRQLINANQTGQNFSGISVSNAKDSNLSDKSLKNTIVAKLHEANADVFNYIDQSGDPSRTLSIVNMAMNYVKYQGLIHNDLALKNVNDYMQDFTNHFSKAYQIAQGENYSFDLKNLGITASEAAILADHVSDEAYQTLGIHKPYSDRIPDKVDDAIKQMWQEGVYNLVEYFTGNRNQLMITNTPDGLIVAKDAAGHVIYSQPFTDSLVIYAHREQ